MWLEPQSMHFFYSFLQFLVDKQSIIGSSISYLGTFRPPFLILTQQDLARLTKIRDNVIKFADQKLNLTINSKNDIIVKTKHSIKFLGTEIFPNGRRLKMRNILRSRNRIDLTNASSYLGLAQQHHSKILKELNWRILEKLEDE